MLPNDVYISFQGSDKDKRKDALEKEEKSKKVWLCDIFVFNYFVLSSMNNQFLLLTCEKNLPPIFIICKVISCFYSNLLPFWWPNKQKFNLVTPFQNTKFEV